MAIKTERNLITNPRGRTTSGTVTVLQNNVTNPAGRATSGTVVVRENLVTNPRLAVDTAGWLFSGGATRDPAIVAFDGPGISLPRVGGSVSVAISSPLEVVPGDVISWSALGLVPVSGTNIRANVTWYDSAGALLAQSAISQITSTTPIRFGVTVTAPANAASARGRVYHDYGVDSDAYATEFLLEKVSTLGDYFDGSYSPDPDLTPVWTGTPDASASQLVGQALQNWEKNSASVGVLYKSIQTSSAKIAKPSPGHVFAHPFVSLSGLAVGDTFTIIAEVLTPRTNIGLVNRSQPYTLVDIETTPDEWTTIRHTGVLSGSGANLQLDLGYENSGLDVGQSFQIRNVAVVPGTYDGPYFDGSSESSDPDLTYVWAGAPDASVSQLIGQASVGWTDAYYSPTTDSIVPLSDGAMFTLPTDPGSSTLVVETNAGTTHSPHTGTVATVAESYFRAAVVPGEYAGPYFDGDGQTTTYRRYSWEGTPHASVSLLEILPTRKCDGMYFGTEERMTWVAAPNIEPDIGLTGWGASGTYLNGGAYVRRSASKHKVYSFSWTLEPYEELQKIKDYDDGVYGQGPIYFLLPGQMDNVLPQYWATPRLGADDGPLLTRSNTRPKAMMVPANSHGYPTASAHYIISDVETGEEYLEEPPTITIPIPEDFVLHLGVHGSFSGTAAMAYSVNDGPWTNLVPLPVDTAQMTNTEIVGPGFVRMRLVGSGTATINSIIGSVRNEFTGPTGKFVSGQGHSGVSFNENGFEINMYSAVKNLYSGSCTLVEIGAWL